MSQHDLGVPASRIRVVSRQPIHEQGDYVLYWMVAYRRTRSNFALQRAAAWARELGRPLVILEALRSGYPWASERLHAFVLQGMADNARAVARRGSVTYYPYVERREGEGRGLLEAIARRACLVVTDDWPAFFVPRMLERAARLMDRRMEAVDSMGLMPMRLADKAFKRAVDFRRHLQRQLAPHLVDFPLEDPTARLGGGGIDLSELQRRWPVAGDDLLKAAPSALARLPIDHEVLSVDLHGGSRAARSRMERFVDERLPDYAETRDRLDQPGGSGLSPYLHFGHISSHEIFERIADSEDWSLERLGDEARGARAGWWGMSESAEALLDQLVTWRELGHNTALLVDGYDDYLSLPDWARRTLEAHARDPRSPCYTLGTFERAATHDEVWNAAQRQLLRTGTMHNRIRMLWGKKILEWTESPRQALEVMVDLNNKYALDGRDPNSYAGIFWVLGRYDRAWGPERAIFGTVRFMSSTVMRKKPGTRAYLDRWSGGPEGGRPVQQPLLG